MKGFPQGDGETITKKLSIFRVPRAARGEENDSLCSDDAKSFWRTLAAAASLAAGVVVAIPPRTGGHSRGGGAKRVPPLA